MGTIDQELLHVIRAMGVMLRSGIGIESVIVKIGEGDYGDIATAFRTVLDEARRGGGMERPFRKLQTSTSSKGFGKLINIIIMGFHGSMNVEDSLDTLADRVLKERKVEVHSFIETIGSRSETFMVAGILVPIILIVLLYVNALLDGSVFFTGFHISVGAAVVLFSTVLLFLTTLVIGTRLKEPAL